MYEITAVIAEAGLLHEKTASLEGAAVAALRQGIALLPMPDALFTEMTGVPPEIFRGRISAEDPFYRTMHPALETLLAGWSSERPIAYVEADFFGGDGYQSAVVWSGGRRRWGPAVDDKFDGPRDDWPINGALARLGVQGHEGASDLFDSVGLGRERSTHDWLPQARTG
ncbi:hypothetical protein [Streptodolium elevatio]